MLIAPEGKLVFSVVRTFLFIQTHTQTLSDKMEDLFITLQEEWVESPAGTEAAGVGEHRQLPKLKVTGNI